MLRNVKMLNDKENENAVRMCRPPPKADCVHVRLIEKINTKVMEHEILCYFELRNFEFFTEVDTRLDNDVVNGHSASPISAPSSSDHDFMNSRKKLGEQAVPRFQLISGTCCERNLRLIFCNRYNGNGGFVETLCRCDEPKEQFYAHVSCVDVVRLIFSDVATSSRCRD